MPRQYWGTSPNENSQFYVRRSKYRRHGWVCFHCRTMVTMYQDNAGVDVFNTHYDVDRTQYGRPSYTASRIRGTRCIGPDQEYEVCPGSDHPAIPLAYKWMDGSPIPDSECVGIRG
jgi:hypothetical protein